MKRITLSILAIAFAMITFTGCSEDAKDQIYPPMTGYWRCTNIGGTAFGVNTPTIANKYLNLFSIGYVGLAGTGYYTRTGSTDLSANASALSAITSTTDGGSSSWTEFFSTGSFTYDTATKTVTHKLDNGETETLFYEILNDGQTLTLTTQVATPASGSTATTVVSALNSILSLVSPNNTISTNVGVVYTYQKSTIAEIMALINNPPTN